MLAWNELDRLIDTSHHVLLTTHVRPDGDALGSELGLAELLIARGKSVEILNSSPTPARYRFLDPDNALFHCIDPADPKPKGQPDLFIVVDTGTWSQLAGLAPYVKTIDYPKVVIDHHVSQDDLGALRLVDTNAAASGMLIAEAYHSLGATISSRTAQALFVAIAMDTGWMRHPNTTPKVLQTQAELMERGAKPHEIYRLLFEQNRVERLRMLGLLFERIERFEEDRLVTSYLAWNDIIDLGAHPMETEDFINELMTLAGVDVAIIFIGQIDGGTKVSFRSRSAFDCSAFAEQFGGGGHRAAAGASLKDPVDDARRRVLPMARRTLSST
jgi:phosphoesterase RecJ-like protein